MSKTLHACKNFSSWFRFYNRLLLCLMMMMLSVMTRGCLQLPHFPLCHSSVLVSALAFRSEGPRFDIADSGRIFLINQKQSQLSIKKKITWGFPRKTRSDRTCACILILNQAWITFFIFFFFGSTAKKKKKRRHSPSSYGYTLYKICLLYEPYSCKMHLIKFNAFYY